jgi:hypothetical protein
MDIEQLKLILETLQGVGHEAGNLAVLYLWLQFGSSALTNLSFVGVFVGVGWIIFKAIKMGSGVDVCENFIREMRDHLGTGISGSLSVSERDRTMAAIRALVAEKRVKEQS